MIPPLFETVLVEAGRIRLRDRHLARLAAAGAPESVVGDVDRLMRRLCEARSERAVVVRIEVGPAGVHAVPRPARGPSAVRLRPRPGYDPADRARERKLLDRRWAGAAEAGLAADEEALLVSAGDLVGETTRANVFAVLDGQVVTPPPRGILPGVTRAWVIGQTGARERDLTLAELLAADAVFLTTAGRGIVTVGDPHAITDELAARWRDL